MTNSENNQDIVCQKLWLSVPVSSSVSQYENAKPSWIVPKHEMMMAVVTIRTLRAGGTNAQLTIWLANRWLTLTAQLTRCCVQLTNHMVNRASPADLCEPSLLSCKTVCDWLPVCKHWPSVTLTLPWC